MKKPKYSISVMSAERITVQDTGERLLSVQFQILDGSDLGIVRRHGFPIAITPDELEAELKKILVTFIAEKESAERNAKTDAEDAQSDETIEAAVGKTITDGDITKE